MKTIRLLPNRLTQTERGQGLVDYVLLLALISLSAIVVLTLVGTNVGEVFDRIKHGFDAEEVIPADQMVVSVVDAAGKGVANVRVYGLNEKGWYLGMVTFAVALPLIFWLGYEPRKQEAGS